jgi:peptide/nickel transport system permease protein
MVGEQSTTFSPAALDVGAGRLERLRPRRSAWSTFLSNPLAAGGLVVLLLLILSAVLAPVLVPYDPNEIDLFHLLSGPSGSHLLGTDDVGRDVLSRLLYAGRVSLSIGVAISLISVSIGAVLGALAGYFGRWIDTLIMAVTNVLLSFPLLGLAMLIAGITKLTPFRLVLILSLLSWMTVARLVRGEILALKQQQFVEAARCIGVSDWRIIFRHMLPNALAPILVAATLLVATAILIESALSFVGFGIRPPTASWGNMLLGAQIYIREAPWLGIFPGLMITLTVISVNAVGDGFRETFDPRLRRR